jgi:hypothetical protein
MSYSEEHPMNESEDQAAERASRELASELKALEARLAALLPRDDRLDRERLMFLAGRASVEVPFETGERRPRVWLKNKAWPAAFAGMTAIAASLLVALFARPLVSEPIIVQVASDEHIASLNRPFAERDLSVNGNVLSPSDARRGDIEKLVSSVPLVAAADRLNPPRIWQDRAALTPGAWREFTEDTETMRPKANDASDMRIFHGATS